MVNEAIIIAGGLGTRLRSVVKDVPKPMANINGRPFLEYLLDYLAEYNIEKVILAVGYKYKVIKKYFGKKHNDIDIVYSIEDDPLGTGGAIRLALEKVKNDKVIILNGDTYFDININDLIDFHKSKNADIVIALKELYDFSRYGIVKIDSKNRIVNFLEKKYRKEGLVNGGIYVLQKNLFLVYERDIKFSFETDFLDKVVDELKIFGKLYRDYFIDIGIPEDLELGRRQMKNI